MKKELIWFAAGAALTAATLYFLQYNSKPIDCDVIAKAAKSDGFIYSTALTNSNLIWDANNLDRWLEKPYELIPGNKMIFSGMKNKNDRSDLLAYLYKETTE